MNNVAVLFPIHRCRFKLIGQQGRGSNRHAIYVCTETNCFNSLKFKGFSLRKKTP